eukprot:gene3793-6954_t
MSLFTKVADALAQSNLDSLDFDNFTKEDKDEFINLNKDSLYDLYEIRETTPLVSNPNPNKKRRSSLVEATKYVNSFFESSSEQDEITIIEKEQEKKLKIAKRVLETQIAQFTILKKFYLTETEESDKIKLTELAETKRSECKESIKVLIGSSIFANENVRYKLEMEIKKKKKEIEDIMKVFEIEEK